MHALWPYIRLARVSMATQSSPPLGPLLAKLIEENRRSVLIAGSADTGLMARVARAGGPIHLDITVLDRCPTPLESCRRLAATWSLPITTVHKDLTELDLQHRFDIVLVHETLPFISSDHLVDVLVRLRRALRSRGVLVLLVKTGRRIAGDLASDSRDGYAEWAIRELERLSVPLPEERDTFAARLRVHAQNRESREGAFSTIDEVNALLKAAGFVISQSLEISIKLADRMQQFVTKSTQRRFVVVAGAKNDKNRPAGGPAFPAVRPVPEDRDDH
jgi:hypothetical protein